MTEEKELLGSEKDEVGVKGCEDARNQSNIADRVIGFKSRPSEKPKEVKK